MIKKFILKALAIGVAIWLFLVTAADMFIKTAGDITPYPAEREITDKIFAISQLHPKTDALRIMSYNLLADSTGFEGSRAQSRADGVCIMFNELSPDVIGLQEVSRSWLACIINNTPYKFINPVKTALSLSMTEIAYNPDTLFLLHSGEEFFKNSYNSALRRMSWAVFSHLETHKLFAIVNTHFSLPDTDKTPIDYTASLMEALEVVDLCNKLRESLNCPVIVTGDFNAKKSTKKTPSPVYDTLLTALYDTAALAQSHCKHNEKNALYYDHIFCKGNIRIQTHCTLCDTDFKLLSDHYPLFCDIIL